MELCRCMIRVGVEEVPEAVPRLERFPLPFACVASLAMCVVTRPMEGVGDDLAVFPALARRGVVAGIRSVDALDPAMPVTTSVTSGVRTWEAMSIPAAEGAAAEAMMGDGASEAADDASLAASSAIPPAALPVAVLGVRSRVTQACTWSWSAEVGREGALATLEDGWSAVPPARSEPGAPMAGGGAPRGPGRSC